MPEYPIMATKQKTPKFFEVTVRVPTIILRDLAGAISRDLEDEYEVKIKPADVLAREGVEAWLKQYAEKMLKETADDLDMYEAMYDIDLEKFFKAEIVAAQAKAEREQALQEARAREIEAAQPASLVIKVPKAQAKAAAKRLKELGFTVQ